MQGEWEDPEVLEGLKSKAASVSLEEGDQKVVELKLIEH